MESIGVILSLIFLVYSYYNYKKSLFILAISILAIIIANIISLYSFSFLLSFKELPSPALGGDYYAQLGQLNYINRTLDLIGNHYYSGKLFSYNPIYSWLGVVIMRLFNLDGITAMKILSYILSYLTIIWFFIALKLSNNPILSLLIYIFILQFSFIILKYTETIIPLIFPIIIYLIINKLYAPALLLAIFSHNILAVFTAVFILVALYLDKDRKAEDLIQLFLIIPVALIIILKLDFELFPRLKLDFPDLTKFEGIMYIYFDYLPSYIINTKLFLPLILYLYLIWKDRKLNYIDYMIILTSFMILSSFITDNIGINFLPSYSTNLILTPLLMFGLIFRANQINNNLILFILILIFSYHLNESINSKIKILEVYNNSMFEILPEFKDIVEIINSDPGVVLSNKPISFLVNAYTGVNVVTSRWAQSFHLPFLNFSNRDLDAAIMLYGNGSDLFEKYKVKYILINEKFFVLTEYSNRIDDILNIIQNKKRINSIEWKIYISDPLICIGCKNKLEENNIKYIEAEAYLDPSMRENYIRTFKVYMIDLRNYMNIKIPPNYSLIYSNNNFKLYKKSQ